jgi:Ala-tRNA(Pro) deacylase
MGEAPPPPPAAAAAATAEEEDPATSARVLALLDAHASGAYTTLRHAPTRTSQESADVRGVALASGAKAMLIRASKPLAHGGPFVLCVLSAACVADLKKLRAVLGVSRLSMASVAEVQAVTGCIPGAVPPFGSLFPGVATLMDGSLQRQGAVINFNCGLRTLSVLGLPVAAYLAIERPTLAEFT